METEVLKYDINLLAWNEEITVPDKRFRNGERGTGKFVTKAGHQIDIYVKASTLDQACTLNDTLIPNSEGLDMYRIVSMDRISDIARLRCHHSKTTASNIKIPGKLSFSIGARVRREGSI